jgi:hypothetical protein
VDENSWYCDSGSTQYIKPKQQYFASYTKFVIPETIVLGKENVLMESYGQGVINF